MIPYLDAVKLIQRSTPKAQIIRCELANAVGHICADDLLSRETLPAFDNSAMDGFAVRSHEASIGAKLPIVGSSFAGSFPAETGDRAQSAWRIMTGAPLPDGYDAIIPIERVAIHENVIEVLDEVRVGQHIRRRGEDFALNAPVVIAGQRIQPFNVMALAATGYASIPVFRPSKAVVFATGDELIEDATQVLQPGQIRNSNAPFLMSALQQFGADAEYAGVQRDNAAEFRLRLSQTLSSEPTLIVSSGAVSAGDADFIPQVIRDLGGEIVFHKVAIKPGKPILFAKFSNGTFYFGLPGNPISTAIGFRFFVQAFLRARCGLSFERTFPVKLAHPLRKVSSLREFRKAKVGIENGELVVAEISGQESHRMAPLQQSNAWLIVEEKIEALSQGHLINVAGWLDESLKL